VPLHHLFSVRSRVDVTMAAALIAEPPEVELQDLDVGGPEWKQIVSALSQSLLKFGLK